MDAYVLMGPWQVKEKWVHKERDQTCHQEDLVPSVDYGSSRIQYLRVYHVVVLRENSGEFFSTPGFSDGALLGPETGLVPPSYLTGKCRDMNSSIWLHKVCCSRIILKSENCTLNAFSQTEMSNLTNACFNLFAFGTMNEAMDILQDCLNEQIIITLWVDMFCLCRATKKIS